MADDDEPGAEPAEHAAKDPEASPTSGVAPPKHTRWKKGEPSPNPSGRPLGISPSEAVKKFGGRSLAQLARVDTKKLTAVEITILKMLKNAMTTAGMREIEFIAERIDGKVPQATIEIQLTPEQSQAMSDDDIRRLLGR